MAFCKGCGKQLPENTKFCPFCGASAAEAPQTPGPENNVDPSPAKEPSPAKTQPAQAQYYQPVSPAWQTRPVSPAYGVQPPKKKKTGAFILLAVSILLIVAGVVLYFVLKDDGKKGGETSTDSASAETAFSGKTPETVTEETEITADPSNPYVGRWSGIHSVNYFSDETTDFEYTLTMFSDNTGKYTEFYLYEGEECRYYYDAELNGDALILTLTRATFGGEEDHGDDGLVFTVDLTLDGDKLEFGEPYDYDDSFDLEGLYPATLIRQ